MTETPARPPTSPARRAAVIVCRLLGALLVSAALAIAYADILQRKEPKKIIIQLSDGLPESWEHKGCMEHVPATDHVVDMIQADKRVQLFGIGFSGAEQRHFKQYTFLTDANEIASTLLNLVRQIVD